MKIGIVTLTLHANYGGILQAYALQVLLERMGHSVEVIESDEALCRKPSSLRLLLSNVKQTIKRLFGRPHRYFKDAVRDRFVFEAHTREFIDAYVHLHKYSSFSSISKSAYDAYVVGSDQVWRPKYFKNMVASMPNAFLSFTRGWDVKRVAYAASFGTSEWEYSQKETEVCKKLLEKFDAVSVREANAVKLVDRYFSREADHLLDPTLLLSQEDYLDLMEKRVSLPSAGNLMCYILDSNEEINEFIDKLACGKGLRAFCASVSEKDRTLPLEQRVHPPVEQWLRGFSDAEFVVTDSFHACVFSIIFKRQFVALGNKGRGMDRFVSLLSLFGLEDRLVSDAMEALSLPEIDYDRVYEKYQVLKDKSVAYLISSLSK